MSKEIPVNKDIPALIDSFADLNVLVIGEAMLDSYLNGPAGGICREAPVPIVMVSDRRDAPGGAANAAVNVCALGARVTFLSVIGADLEGRLLREALRLRGVNTEYVMTHTRRRTIAKHRVTADGQLLVRFDQGSTDVLDADTEVALMEDLAELFPRMDAVIVSDYCCGILTPRVIERLTELQARSPRLLIADAKRLDAYRAVGVTVVKPNYHEAVQLLGIAPAPPTKRADEIVRHGERLLELSGAQLAAITLDSEGAVILERGGTPFRTYGRRVPSARTAGAGDTFVGALALSLAAGAHTTTAAELASAAAGLAVGREGTASCSLSELRGYFTGGEKYLGDRARLIECVKRHRAEGRRVVFTNGCFDILHRGHIAHLGAAKALGDVLIVGLNDDTSAQRLKGTDRPINGLEDRLQVLMALSCVDYVIPFDGDTAVELVQAIRPDVFVKGGDHHRNALPEAPVVEALGGTVRILPYLEDRSTARVIERIRGERRRAEATARNRHGKRRVERRNQPAMR